MDTKKENTKKIRMEVTEETIRDYGIKKEEVLWKKISNRRVRVIEVETTDEIYKEYMRSVWREDKQEQRRSGDISFEDYIQSMPESIGSSDTLEEIVTKKYEIELLHQILEELEKIDYQIIDMYFNGVKESKIGEILGMSQSAISKRKKALMVTIKTKIKKILEK